MFDGTMLAAVGEEPLDGREDRVAAQVGVPRVGRSGDLGDQFEELLRVDHLAGHELSGIQQVLPETANDLREGLGVGVVVEEVHVTHAVDEEMPLPSSRKRRDSSPRRRLPIYAGHATRIGKRDELSEPGSVASVGQVSLDLREELEEPALRVVEDVAHGNTFTT